MVFSGNLNDFDLIDFIKLVCAMKKTAVLRITGKLSAKIYLEDGIIKGIQVPEQFMQTCKEFLSTIKEGEFALEEPVMQDLENFHKVSEDTNAFLLDLARYRENPPDINLYTPDMSFELRPTSDIGKLVFTDLDWKVIALLTEQKKINDLVARLNVSIEKLQWVLYSLETAGLIQRKRPKEEFKGKAQTRGVINQLRDFLSRITPKW